MVLTLIGARSSCGCALTLKRTFDVLSDPRLDLCPWTSIGKHGIALDLPLRFLKIQRIHFLRAHVVQKQWLAVGRDPTPRE